MSMATVLPDLSCQLRFRQVLAQLQGWLVYEQMKREEWFEVEDAEMIAYHRGYERGLERSIATIEAALHPTTLT